MPYPLGHWGCAGCALPLMGTAPNAAEFALRPAGRRDGTGRDGTDTERTPRGHARLPAALHDDPAGIEKKKKGKSAAPRPGWAHRREPQPGARALSPSPRGGEEGAPGKGGCPTTKGLEPSIF